MSKLTAKMQRFVDEYMVDLNATQAAIRAGYSKKTANEQAARLLAKVSIKSAVAERMKQRAETSELNEQWVLDRLQKLADRCMQAEPVLDRRGNPTGFYTFDSAGANRALELIGKHRAMFTDKLRIGDLDAMTDDQLDKQISQLAAESGEDRTAATTH